MNPGIEKLVWLIGDGDQIDDLEIPGTEIVDAEDISTEILFKTTAGGSLRPQGNQVTDAEIRIHAGTPAVAAIKAESDERADLEVYALGAVEASRTIKNVNLYVMTEGEALDPTEDEGNTVTVRIYGVSAS